MARPSNSAERRQQIVSGLLTVVAERGYDGASINSIAHAAGLAPGLIHYYFTNKQEILLEAIRDLDELFERRFAALVVSAKTPAARLRAFVDARLAKGEKIESGAVGAWVMIGAEAVRQPEVRVAYQAALARQLALLESLLRDYAGTSISGGELRQLTAVVLAAMEGAFQLSVSADGIMPRDYAAKTVMRLIERYLGATAA
jgi:TetR/AcrR family transcriptional regulator, transcriptional repressor of bet genes